MTDPRADAATPFPEELLSGYLDGALTQQEEQRVRLHLERSAPARALLDEMAALRQASRSAEFAPVEDVQWSEAARTPGSAMSRRIGLVLLVLWLAGAAVLALQGMMSAAMTWWQAAMLIVGLGGALLLFFSVLADRVRDARTDRYRRVLK